MNVFQIRLKIFLLKDIELELIQSKIAAYIDKTLGKNEQLLGFHDSNEFKNYCFDAPFPLEIDKIYKKDNVYTLTLRTIDKDLADFFTNILVNQFNEDIKALTSEIRILSKKHIDKIYSVTPVIIKTDSGYWKGNITLDEYERRIKENLVKKYNYAMNTKINEDFQLYTAIEFKNKKPISTNYKNIKLLGDKISLNISDEFLAQELAYMSLGTGLSEMNARGYGFVNFRWL